MCEAEEPNNTKFFENMDYFYFTSVYNLIIKKKNCSGDSYVYHL